MAKRKKRIHLKGASRKSERKLRRGGRKSKKGVGMEHLLGRKHSRGHKRGGKRKGYRKSKRG